MTDYVSYLNERDFRAAVETEIVFADAESFHLRRIVHKQNAFGRRVNWEPCLPAVIAGGADEVDPAAGDEARFVQQPRAAGRGKAFYIATRVNFGMFPACF